MTAIHIGIKKTAVVVIVALMGVLIPLGMQPSGVLAAPLCVNPTGSSGCFTTIQAAVNAAGPGDTINVAAGIYKEMVSITQCLTLQGAAGATIDATGLDHGIVVTGVTAQCPTNSVVINGFTVENANLAGIMLTDSSHLLIENNTVQNNNVNLDPGTLTCPGAGIFEQFDCGEGIYLQGISFSTFSNNLVQHNAGGILVSDETGPTHDNLITGNIVQFNIYDCGITLASHPTITFTEGPPIFGPAFGIYSNVVTHNISTANGTAFPGGAGAGVGLFGPTPGTAVYNNTVSYNTLTSNGLPGVALHSHTFGQNLNGNVIIYNTISGNGGDEDPRIGPTGIEIFSDASGGAAPIAGMTITHNTIHNEQIGVYFGTTASSLGLHWNDLSMNTFGVVHVGGGIVDAGYNYWGCPLGPSKPGCSSVQGLVKTIPWLLQHP